MKYDLVNGQSVTYGGCEAAVRGVFVGCVAIEILEGPLKGQIFDVDEDELAEENDLIEL